MAEPLSRERGHNGGEQEQYHRYISLYERVDERVKAALEQRAKLRKQIRTDEGKAYLAAFDAARRETKWSGAYRVELDGFKRRMLEWEAKPLGFQPGFDLSDSPPPTRELSETEMDDIHAAGYDAGQAGKDATKVNPWTPGTRPSDQWMMGWQAGQADKVSTDIAPAEPKRAGRPKGSKNKAKAEPAPAKRSENGQVLAEPNQKARDDGFSDGFGQVMDHAAAWPSGAPGHGDYVMGVADGERARAEQSPPLH